MRGLTTAATLWVVAAIGMAAGAGYYARRDRRDGARARLARPAALLSYALVARVRPEEAELAIELAPEGAATRVLDCDRGARRRDRLRRVRATSARSTSSLRARRRSESARVAEELTELDDVERVQWRPLRARLALRRTAHKLEELRAALPGWELELLDGDGATRPEDGATYYENARVKARVRPRASARPTPGCSARTPASRSTRSAARPGIASARWADGRRREAARGARRRRRPRARATSASSSRSRPDGEEGAAPASSRATIATERARQRGLRLRPDLRPARRGADRRRARRRLEARALPPRPRRRRPRRRSQSRY